MAAVWRMERFEEVSPDWEISEQAATEAGRRGRSLQALT
jgi:hypothetical protein